MWGSFARLLELLVLLLLLLRGNERKRCVWLNAEERSGGSGRERRTRDGSDSGCWRPSGEERSGGGGGDSESGRCRRGSCCRSCRKTERKGNDWSGWGCRPHCRSRSGYGFTSRHFLFVFFRFLPPPSSPFRHNQGDSSPRQTPSCALLEVVAHREFRMAQAESTRKVRRQWRNGQLCRGGCE